MKWCNLLMIGLLFSCSKEQQSVRRLKDDNLLVENILRKESSKRYSLPIFEEQDAPKFPWERGAADHLPLITKEFFRCRGSDMNPKRMGLSDLGDTEELCDCGGFLEHGLPLHEGKEWVPPILIELLNDLQESLKVRVVITSGHRCPKHNSYVDPSKANQTSKHLLAAEVSFYVEGYEWKPQEVVNVLLNSQEGPFSRWERETNVSTKPWYNEEIFIKLFRADEGRNFDNRHPYPYISIQVRFDKERGERVTYSWEKANRHYLRK